MNGWITLVVKMLGCHNLTLHRKWETQSLGLTYNLNVIEKKNSLTLGWSIFDPTLGYNNPAFLRVMDGWGDQQNNEVISC